MNLPKPSSLTSVGVTPAVAAPSLVSPVADALLLEQAVLSKPVSNSTLRHSTVSQEQNEAASTSHSAILEHPHSECASQAARIADREAGKMPVVVAGLCIAAGVAGVAGGLGLGMGLEEEKRLKKDESIT